MVRFRIIGKFEGLNEKGLTFNEVIQEDVKNHINTFLYNSSHITNKEGDIEWMNIANVSNARFVLGRYYEEYLDSMVPENLAKELKQKIIDSIGLDKLLRIDGSRMG